MLLVLAACSSPDTNVKEVDLAPDVSFVDPADGASFGEGAALTFVAGVSDDHDALEDLVYAWTKADGSALVGSQDYLEDQVRFTAPDGLTDGEYVVTLEVTDSAYNVGSDTVSFTILDNTAPTLTFAEPTDTAVYTDLDDIAVDLVASDPDEDDLNALVLAWSGDLSAGAPANPTSDGHARYTVDARPAGTYALSVVATDSLGSTAYAEVSVTVLASDADGDGHVADTYGGDDCDDGAAAVHPGADELCDGVDDDCDGAVDEDAVDAATGFPDADGDGYGDEAAPSSSCDGAGLVSDGADCDDGDPTVHPGATETCDGRDEDCDGTIDDAAVDAPAWYDDIDGDGFGDPSAGTTACSAPSGAVADATDCDDLDPGVNPDAGEVCDGVDDDCDGAIDEGAIGTTWYADADGDGHGGTTSTAACAVPAGYVAISDDCDDADADTFPGAPELCDGRDNDCDGTVDEDAVSTRTWYGDGDGDGYGGATTAESCAAPSGYVATGGDCVDSDAAIHPMAPETCDGVDEDCDGDIDEGAVDATTWYTDSDGDGYGDDAAPVVSCTAAGVALGGDCDDAAADVHPGAVERCDGADDDCDGDIDGDAVDRLTWYTDGDGDGWGIGSGTLACEGTGVTTDGDCADADAAIHPEAAEVCDGVDDDCDGLVDDADPSVTGGEVVYADTDADGYGDPTMAGLACAVSAGWVADATDCDDAHAGAHPGATESCATAYDDDCDGSTNEAGASGCVAWYTDGDHDGFGGTSSVCACAADGGYTTSTGGDCDDGAVGVNPGATEVCENGVDDDCDGADASCPLVGTVTTSDADWTILAAATGTQLGEQVAFLPDSDGDGLDEVAVASFAYGSSAGAVWVFAGSGSGTSYVSAAPTAITGGSSGDGFGQSLAGGDFDGDGVGDLLVGTMQADEGGTSSGGAWIFLGPLPAGVNNANSVEDLGLYGGTSGDDFGCAVAALPDVDGDGADEVAVGAMYQDSGGTNAGAVFLQYGPLTTTAAHKSSNLMDARILGEDSGDYFGTTVAPGGDFDGDGLEDLLIGAYGEDLVVGGGGAVYVASGVRDFASSTDASALDWKFGGEGSGASWAYSPWGHPLSGGADLDADGYDDFVVGCYQDDTAATDAGAAYFVAGRSGGGSYALTTTGTKIYGEGANDAFGYSVATGGDVDGDGFADFVVSAETDDDGGSNSGSVYLYYGSATLSGDYDAKLIGDDAGDYFGVDAVLGGDTDGDGYGDLLVGAYLDDEGYTTGGAARVYRGAGR